MLFEQKHLPIGDKTKRKITSSSFWFLCLDIWQHSNIKKISMVCELCFVSACKIQCEMDSEISLPPPLTSLLPVLLFFWRKWQRPAGPKVASQKHGGKSGPYGRSKRFHQLTWLLHVCHLWALQAAVPISQRRERGFTQATIQWWGEQPSFHPAKLLFLNHNNNCRPRFMFHSAFVAPWFGVWRGNG